MAAIAALPTKFPCIHCDLKFSKQSNLTRHRRNVHQESIARSRAAQTCPLCPFEYQSRAAYASHLAETHDSVLTEDCLEFVSLEEFFEWKRDEERRTVTSFVRNTAKKRTSGGIKTYYICCRKGYYKSESKGKKLIRQQGTRKINSSCPAAMTVLEVASSEGVAACVRVSYVSTHVGHDNRLALLDLSRTERAQVADQISLGFSPDLILKNFRNGVAALDSQRARLLKKRDIHNIARSFKLDIRKPDIELSGIDHWAGLLDAGGGGGGHSPLLCYKPRGTVDARYEELRDDDFVLGVMNDTQQALLTRLGPRLVCLDCTDGFTGVASDARPGTGVVRLVSLLVLDESVTGEDCRRALPVALMVAGRLDHSVLVTFLRCVRQRVGTMLPEVLVSGGGIEVEDGGSGGDVGDQCDQSDVGDRDVFYEAWCEVMGVPQQRWMCGWQVSSTWERHLKGMPKDVARNTRRKVEAMVRERDLNTFQQLLRKTLEDLTNCRITTDFARHLTAHWAPLSSRWAHCYRSGTIAGTAAVASGLEPAHREMRQRFTAATAASRRRWPATLELHAVLADMMGHARDTLLGGERRPLGHRRLLDETILERLQAAGVARHSRCEAAVGLQLSRGDDERVWMVEEEEVAVGGDTNVRQIYEVTVTTSDSLMEIGESGTECNCSLACPCCRACVHAYLCTCLDYALCFNSCVHLHAVAMVVAALPVAITPSPPPPPPPPPPQLDISPPVASTGNEGEGQGLTYIVATEDAVAVAAEGISDVIMVHEVEVDDTVTPLVASTGGCDQFVRLQQEVVTAMNELIQECETMPQLEALRRMLDPIRPALSALKESGQCVGPKTDEPGCIDQ